MELGHLLTSSGFTRLEVSLMVFPVILPVGCFFVFSITHCKPFCLHVATNLFCIPVFCPKLGLYFLFQSLCLSYNRSQCILLFSQIFHLCCCYSSCVSCLMVQFSPPYNRAGRASVLYSFSKLIRDFLRIPTEYTVQIYRQTQRNSYKYIT